MIRQKQRDTAAMLMAAIGQATEDGLFDLMVADVQNPDTINDFIDTLENVTAQLANPGRTYKYEVELLATSRYTATVVAGTIAEARANAEALAAGGIAQLVLDEVLTPDEFYSEVAVGSVEIDHYA